MIPVPKGKKQSGSLRTALVCRQRIIIWEGPRQVLDATVKGCSDIEQTRLGSPCNTSHARGTSEAILRLFTRGPPVATCCEAELPSDTQMLHQEGVGSVLRGDPCTARYF